VTKRRLTCAFYSTWTVRFATADLTSTTRPPVMRTSRLVSAEDRVRMAAAAQISDHRSNPRIRIVSGFGVRRGRDAADGEAVVASRVGIRRADRSLSAATFALVDSDWRRSR